MNNLLKNKKLIIFDLDGVLIDTSKIHENAFKEVLQGLNITDFHYNSYAGMSTLEVFQKVCELNKLQLSEERLSKLVKRKRSLARSRIQVLVLDERLIHFLERISNNYILAIATSASENNLKSFLAKIPNKNLFKCTLSSKDVSQGKPNPEIYLKVLEQLNIKAKEALVIEDSENGILSALHANIDVIQFSLLANDTFKNQVKAKVLDLGELIELF